jgi:deazaflavin-dependent oxidoreductase (nitroreductase family)
MADYNDEVINDFREHNGHVGGVFGGMQLLLLNYKGAKSGKSFTKPLAYSMDGYDYVIVASKGGSPTHPEWYYNLKANPDVEIEVAGETLKATAEEALGEERNRLFRQHADLYPGFNDYEAKTTRTIPVFRLKKS